MFENNIEKEKLGPDDEFVQFLQNDGDIKQAIVMFEVAPETTENNRAINVWEVRTW